MIKEAFGGLCMALADSVPGVSGGTIAFILGFYDKFIGSINDLVFGRKEDKISAIKYLVKLGIGWIIGMGAAVMALSALFESHIYVISSLFIGFIAGSIPLIIREEKESFRQFAKGIVFCLLGTLIVAGITWMNGRVGSGSMNLGHFSIGLGIKLFLIGMVAISAMFLPGISGSTLLLIFGAYMPVMTAIRGFIGLDLSYLPALMCFGFGVIAGAVTVVRGIKVCLDRFRPQMVYMILGMMLGSFYAIIQGPTTLDVPQDSLSFGNFSITAALIGLVLVLGLQFIKERNKER